MYIENKFKDCCLTLSRELQINHLRYTMPSGITIVETLGCCRAVSCHMARYGQDN